MRYLGAKGRIAAQIAAAVAPRGVWWEPFCGSLAVSVKLAQYGQGVASDASAPLISLYQAARAGWVPPTTVSREQYAAARLLPDSDPMKAFVGFSQSFGGKWFGGYAVEQATRSYTKAGKPAAVMEVDTMRAAAAAIARDVSQLGHCMLMRLSFFDVDPASWPAQPECIYADPPYEGTEGYGTGPFDHARFWAYCRAWAARGVRVFASEYQCPIPARIVWSRSHRDRLRAADGSQRLKCERLFQVAAGC